ncbi:uncharacterized protein LOC119070645 [Bradysia coprophila]|uniref:uncharacterized protein LOC119070645 n=1 Tax=Bradysia coprophila TaxID=38358 RepID=UPI00187D800F|nr:uncharacterized protein LOC119070645 [Bradysia coprophila]
MFPKLFYVSLVIFLAYYTKITSSECVGQFYAHPRECSLYYQCSKGSLIEMTCPDGLHFLPTYEICGYPDGSCDNTPSDATEKSEESLISRIEKLEAKSIMLEAISNELDNRSAILEQKSIELEDRSNQLDVRSTLIEERTEALEIRSMELEAKSIRLENMSSNLQLELDFLSTILVAWAMEQEKRTTSLETQATKLNTTMTQSNTRTTQLEGQTNEIAATLTSTVNSLNDFKKVAITNIRLGPLERAIAWNDFGFQDGLDGITSVVITSVINYNEDAYIDYVERRRIEKFVNGQWTGLV